VLAGRRASSALTKVGPNVPGAPERTTKARFEGGSIPGADLPPIEPTKEEIRNVLFEYGVLFGNFAMTAFIAAWYIKKIAWTKDPGENSNMRACWSLVTAHAAGQGVCTACFSSRRRPFSGHPASHDAGQLGPGV